MTVGQVRMVGANSESFIAGVLRLRFGQDRTLRGAFSISVVGYRSTLPQLYQTLHHDFKAHVRRYLCTAWNK